MKNKLLKAGIILAVLAVALLVMAGAGAADKTVTTYSELKDALDSGEEYIIVGKDIEWKFDDQTLVVLSGRTQTLDLNGHILRPKFGIRFLDVEQYSTFILRGDGEIDNDDASSSDRGGTVRVCSNSTFIMEEGTIRDSGSVYGGAVYVEDGGQFIMNGGKITGCCADKQGGAIFINKGGKFTMNGGEISDCYTIAGVYSDYGGGGAIYLQSYESSGQILLNDGTITGCNAKSGEGGAIFLQYEGEIIMKPGFTISNCHANSDTGGHGGAIQLSSGGILTIEGGTISGCTSWGAGGAIFIEDNSRADLSNLTIDGCTSKNGGAIYVDDDQNASLQMTNCTIKNCYASSNGGGIFADEKVNITLTDCFFSGCTASEHGGSVLYVDDNSQSTLTDCIISGCSSTKDGGAIYLNNNATCTLTGGKIMDCYSKQNGGAIYLNENGKCTVSGTTIENCHSDGDGGAVYLDDDNTSFTMKDSSSIANCTAGNRAGAIHIDDKGICDITGSTITYCYCDVDGGAVYVNNDGTCTVSDTAISNCHAEQDGGAIYLNKNGTCTITRITIEDCYADRDGGAVYIDDNNTSVTMKDSTITRCNAQKGGGVHINDKGSFTMTDSTISGCTASEHGGGVYVSKNGTFTMNGGEIYHCNPDAVYIDGKGSYSSSSSVTSVSSAAAENVFSKEIINSVGDGESESSNGKVVINGGIIDGKVINNGDLDIGGDTGITEIELPSGKKITFLDTITDGAKIGIKLEDPENAGKIFENFKTEIIKKKFIECLNANWSFSVDDDGNPVLWNASTGKIIVLDTVTQGTVSGNTVTFPGSDTRVSGIVFTGNVTSSSYIDGLGVTSEPSGYKFLGGFRILVEPDSNLEGTITFTAESSYPAGVRLMHYENNTWIPLTTKVLEDGTYEADTPSFSPFAIVQYAEPAKSTSSVTSFSGTKDGSDFTFDRAVVITKATLPGATSATVTNTNGSGWYTCNLSSDGFSGNGVLYFQVPLDVIDIKGYTVNDVSLLGCRTTYLGTEGKYAKYSAVITRDGALTIDFEEDAAQKVVETKPVTVETPETQEPVKTVETPVTTENPVTTETTTAKSPFPVLGILAGLGIAGVLLMRRK